MIKLAILALFGYLGWRAWRRLTGRGAGQGAVRRGPGGSGESRLVFDPQCRTYVPEEGAERISVRGQMVYFCSPECRQAYLEKTERDKA